MWLLTLAKIYSQFQGARHFEHEERHVVEQTKEEEVERAVGAGQVPPRHREGLRVCHSGQVLQERQGEQARVEEGNRDPGRERLPHS